MFKQGAFVNVLTSDAHKWRAALQNAEGLPNLDHIELWVEHIPRGAELNEFKDIFRGVRLLVHGPFIHTSLVSHLPDVVSLTERRFDEAIEFAASIDAALVTFHAGSYPIFESKAAVLDKLATRFERFANLRAPVATLENMPLRSHGTVREPIGHLSDCDNLIKLLPNVRFTLDIGHCLQNDDDWTPFITTHGSRIENIHLHDGMPRGRAHLRLGAGTLDLGRLLDVLVSVGFEGYVGLETISPEDTSASWQTLCRAEYSKGLRHRRDAHPVRNRFPRRTVRS